MTGISIWHLLNHVSYSNSKTSFVLLGSFKSYLRLSSNHTACSNFATIVIINLNDGYSFNLATILSISTFRSLLLQVCNYTAAPQLSPSRSCYNSSSPLPLKHLLYCPILLRLPNQVSLYFVNTKLCLRGT